MNGIPTDSAEFESRTYTKVTLRLIPLLFVCYVISYLDRVNVGFAKLQMAADLGFTDAIYGLGAGIFFVGYFLFEVPSNLLLHRIGARPWITRIMVTWGVLSACNAFVSTAEQFYALRFALGVAEAGFFPGVLLYLSHWFPIERCGRTTALLMTAVPMTGVIGSPLSGWILHSLNGYHRLAGWQWLFIAEALPAIIASGLVWRVLSNRIDDAQWLSQPEKDLLTRQLAKNRELARTSTIRAAAGQLQFWLLCAIYFCFVVGLYGVGFWLPTIIRATGVGDPLHIGLLGAIPYAVAAAVMIPVSRRSDRRNERRRHVAASAIIGGLGLGLSTIVTHNTALSILTMTLATTGIVAGLPLFWGLPYSRLVGVAAAAGLAMINSVGNLGGFAGPYLIGTLSNAAHGTSGGIAALAAFLFVGAALTLSLSDTITSPSTRDSA